ncbi:MAG: Gfo/Idh/MocA family protein [Gemmatimonadota bacterium]
MKTVRTCVIGVGRVGAEHARILAGLPGSRLVGIHDVDRERGEEIARRLGARHFAGLSSLLREAEAAVVAVPTAGHESVARAALEAGCHVLIEKPLAPTLQAADRLLTLAEQRGLHLGVGHVERFNPVLRLAARHLGNPLFVESLRLSPFPGRGTDVTVVLDLMIHDIDLVLGLVGSSVRSVHAVGVPVVSGSVDIANARLVFESGAVANITASRVSAERKRHLRLFQPTGYLSLDLDAGRGEFLRRRQAPADPVGDARRQGVEGPAWAPASATASGEAARAVAAVAERGDGVPTGLAGVVERLPLIGSGPEPLKVELLSFLRAIRGVSSELVSAREGRAALELALRITREIEESADVVAAHP